MAVESPSAVDTKRVYEAVVGFVDRNTGGAQPPITTTASVTGSVCRRSALVDGDGTVHPDAISSAISEAGANGDLFRWSDRRCDPPRYYVGIDDADALEEKADSYVERKSVRTEEAAIRVKVARKRIEALRGDRDGE